MKLFQIEEPDGSQPEAEGPGAAVGIDLSFVRGAAVAVAVGGNAEILAGSDGVARLPVQNLRRSDGRWDEAASSALLLALRERAEKALARPVTHAVIAVDALDDSARRVLMAAAGTAQLAVLRLLDAGAAAARASDARSADAAVLGAALQAEDDAASLQPR
jgi:molecular chaperone HscA